MDTKIRGYETVQVHRFHQDLSENEMDYIVQEYPVALIYNGIFSRSYDGNAVRYWGIRQRL